MVAENVNTVLVPLLSGAIGAIIGTFGGVYFSFLRQEKARKGTRMIAIKAIGVFYKYSHKDGTFKQAENEFNNCISVAEKRVVLVALHQLGIPVIVRPGARFVIDNVSFDSVKVEKDELQTISNQIKQGLCDHLFFRDPETYFNENIRISSLRVLAKKWVSDVLSKSTFKVEENTVYYPVDWASHFSWGEKLSLAVFKTRVSVNEFFDINGKAEKEKIKQLIQEVDRGLWDNSLLWDIEAYQSMQSANNVNSRVNTMLQ